MVKTTQDCSQQCPCAFLANLKFALGSSLGEAYLLYLPNFRLDYAYEPHFYAYSEQSDVLALAGNHAFHNCIESLDLSSIYGYQEQWLFHFVNVLFSTAQISGIVVLG